MGLTRRLYDLLFEHASAAVDKASDPADKVRAVMHNVADQAPVVMAAVAGPIARYKDLQEKELGLKRKIADLTAQASAAIGKNEAAARIFAEQVIDNQKRLASLQADLAQAKTRADQAREHYDDWKRRTDEMHAQAAEALSDSERARAQEVYNSAMQQINTAGLDSTFGDAISAIRTRAQVADATTDINEDPTATALRSFDKQQRSSAVDDFMTQLKAKGSTS